MQEAERIKEKVKQFTADQKIDVEINDLMILEGYGSIIPEADRLEKELKNVGSSNLKCPTCDVSCTTWKHTHI